MLTTIFDISCTVVHNRLSLTGAILKFYSVHVNLLIKSIRVHLVLRFCSVSWPYFDDEF